MRYLAGFGDSIVYGSNLERPWLYTFLDRFSVGAITHTPTWPWTWVSPPTITNRNTYWYESTAGRVYNMGLGGNTTADMVARFTTDVAYRDPSYCMTLGGINDIYGNVSLTTTQANLASLYTSCVSNGIIPVPCTLTPVKAGTTVGTRYAELTADILSLNSWIRARCTANGYDCIDFHAMLVGDTAAYIASDGIHPTQAGYDAMGAGIDLSYFGLTVTATADSDSINLDWTGAV